MNWEARLAGRYISDSRMYTLRLINEDAIGEAKCDPTSAGTIAFSELQSAKWGKGLEKGISAEEYMKISAFAKSSENCEDMPLDRVIKSKKEGKIASDKLEKYLSHKDYQKDLVNDLKKAIADLQSVEKSKPKFWQKLTLGKEEYDKKMSNYNARLDNAKLEFRRAQELIVSPTTISKVDSTEIPITSAGPVFR
ncbi:hypothetical protein J6Q66_02590 [bacterium]|nr:hypothetical protein [bacterium]